MRRTSRVETRCGRTFILVCAVSAAAPTCSVPSGGAPGGASVTVAHIAAANSARAGADPAADGSGPLRLHGAGETIPTSAFRGFEGDAVHVEMDARTDVDGDPKTTGGHFRVTHVHVDGRPVADFEGDVTCLAAGGREAIATGVVTGGEAPWFPGLPLIGRKVAISVEDDGPHRDRLGWVWGMFGTPVSPTAGAPYRSSAPPAVASPSVADPPDRRLRRRRGVGRTFPVLPRRGRRPVPGHARDVRDVYGSARRAPAGISSGRLGTGKGPRPHVCGTRSRPRWNTSGPPAAGGGRWCLSPPESSKAGGRRVSIVCRSPMAVPDHASPRRPIEEGTSCPKTSDTRRTSPQWTSAASPCTTAR
ncbi:hypothetical protein ABIA38_002888 [Embleya sp. AB8]